MHQVKVTVSAPFTTSAFPSWPPQNSQWSTQTFLELPSMLMLSQA
jgi:hypothetical protein